MRKVIFEKADSKKFIRLLAVMIIAVMALKAGAIIAKANTLSTKQNLNESKYYTSVYIYPGDTLWSIAETYMDTDYYDNMDEYIAELKQMNGLKTDKIKSGNYLTISYYKSNDNLATNQVSKLGTK